ncbi:MAG TPA: amidohydrolase family protein [Actinomycetota bacterium]|nr:amidohydrolase family protein [Actinomycetota bacterium]
MPTDEPTAQPRRGPVIDIHCHVYTPACEPLVRDLPALEAEPFDHFGGPSTEYNRRHFAAIGPQLTTPDVRLADMDRMGVDVQAISVAPPQYYYRAPGRLGRRLARVQNDHLAEIVAGHPDRFVGLGTVPLQDPEAAVAELGYVAGELAFRGIEICSNVAGEDLDDPRFLPFWEEVQRLGLLVVIHPHGFTQGDRLTDYYLINVIGNPLDSTVAVARLVFGGVLERYPALRVCVVHGGGYLPFYPYRMDHAWKVRPESRQRIPHPPSTYLARLYFDTVVFDPGQLASLVRWAGADHVLLGTDYPYDMGESDPVRLVSQVPGLDPAGRDAILGGNAARLLELAPHREMDGGRRR